MTDDISEIETGASCYVLNNATTIYSYKSNTRKTYIQIGGKWYQNAQTTYTNIPSGTYCVNYSFLQELNSKAEYFPIYEFIALVMAVFVWFMVWFLLRKVVKWRI